MARRTSVGARLRTGWEGAWSALSGVLLLLSSAAASCSDHGSGSLPATLPAAKPKRARAIDVQHIAAALRVHVEKQQLEGEATLHLTLLQPAREVRLDALDMLILDVHNGQGQSLAFQVDPEAHDLALRITLPRLHAEGETLALTIRYRTMGVNRSDPANLGGSVGQGVRYFEPSVTEPRRRRQVWVAGEPEGNRYWLPGLDVPNDLRTFELRLRVDPGLSAIANGECVGQEDHADGTRSFHWRLDHPQPHARSAFVVGEFVRTAQVSGRTAIDHYGYPDERAATAASVERVPDMLRFFERYTAMPYPYSSYTQVMVQELPWGMANTSLAIQTENMVDDFDTHAEFLYLWDGLAAESLAAQWFGGVLTPREWSDVWLTRAFAHYFDGLYTEHRNGRSEFLLWYRRGDHNTYAADWQAGVRDPVVTRHYADARSFTSSNAPSVRGSMVLHMLRKLLGDQSFQRAIQHYLREHQGKLVSTQDFIDAVEESSGQTLDWFFAQWLYGIGHPEFELSRSYDANTHEVVLGVRQTQQRPADSAHPHAGYFQGPVEIELDGRVERVWIEARAEQQLRIASPKNPAFVHFDVEETWIKTLVHDKPVDELLSQVQHSHDPAGRFWAMNQLVAKATSNDASPRLRRRVVETLLAVAEGREHTLQAATTGLRANGVHDPYWRIRYGALFALNGMLVPAQSTAPVSLEPDWVATLKRIIAREQQWTKAQAIWLLGASRNAQHVPLYLGLLNDRHDRVINAAANALGRSGDARALPALLALADHPSWKNQSLISALNGLRELKDPAGGALALHALTERDEPRWTLAVSRWDYRLAAAETLRALGQSASAVPSIEARLEAALRQDNLNDVFSNLLVFASLGEAPDADWLPRLRKHYRKQPQALAALDVYAEQFAGFTKP